VSYIFYIIGVEVSVSCRVAMSVSESMITTSDIYMELARSQRLITITSYYYT
jgi:hypothetical protein